MPTISVIVPVYRAEAYLPECLHSILSQTFRDFELLLVDDGSPDGSGEICDAYAGRDHRITVIHQDNQGQAAARNRAIAMSRGKWLCFIDSDDAVHPRLLELLLAGVTENDCDISMCRMLEAPDLPDAFFAPREAAFRKECLTEENLLAMYDADRYPGWVACGKLISREIVAQELFVPGRIFEDNEAVCRWICRAKSLAVTEEDLYYYRTNPESTTQRTYSLKKLDYLWALERIQEQYGAVGYLRMQRRFFDRYLDAVDNACGALLYTLDDRRQAVQVERQCYAFARRSGQRLDLEQRGRLLSTMHPHLARVYWPVAGVLRTVRRGGFRALWKKLRSHFGKGAGM